MSMDATIHLHLVLDRLREAQILHGEMLREILRLQRLTLRPSRSPEPAAPSLSMKWSFFLKQVATSGGQWAGGIMAMAYVARGGDLMTGIKSLMELLKLL